MNPSPLANQIIAADISAEIPAISVRDLTVAYSRKPVLRDVHLDLPQGQLIAIVGPNGAGKSTLLKTIMGVIQPGFGTVHFLGKPLEEQRGLVAYVPQRGSVDWDFPTNVMDVALMGRYGKLGLFRRPSANDKAIAAACLEKVGMQAYKSRQISQLSGGQQQRVFLARALAQEAAIYLMDEPFAGVDAATERAIIEILRELKSQKKTVAVVHHDLQTVPTYFDHVALVNMRIVAAGPTATHFTSENLRQTYGGALTLLSDVLNALPGGHD